MNFLDRLGGALRGASAGFTQPQNSITTSRELEESILSELRGAVAGVTVNTESAQRQRTVATCIRVISEDVASLQCRIVRRDGKVSTPLPDHPLHRLLTEGPTEGVSGFEFHEWLVRMLEARGNAYCRKVRGFGNRLVELVPLETDRMTVKRNQRGQPVYEYAPEGRARVELTRDQVFHLRGPSDDGLQGRSTIADHRETIGEAIAQQRTAVKFFESGIKPSVVLEQEAGTALGEGVREQLRAEFRELYAGVENYGKPVLLPDGIKMNPFTVTAEDAQYIEQRKFSRSEIAGIFRIPPHKIGDLERATFSNIEHQEIGYVTGSVTPRCRRIQAAVKRDLLAGEDGVCLEHNTDELMRGDAKSRAEAKQIERRNGVINANEWRADLGLNPRDDEGGDEYIIEQNMAPQDGARDPEGTMT
jgi:HK97 family phage portal protein